LQTDNKVKYQIPTEEEFLKFRPKRLDFNWSINEEGLVELIVPKFKGKIGKSLCTFIKKENFFIAKMDKIGSMVWTNSDGIKTVEQILHLLKKEFPNVCNIDQRLFLFIQQMGCLNYLIY